MYLKSIQLVHFYTLYIQIVLSSISGDSMRNTDGTSTCTRRTIHSTVFFLLRSVGGSTFPHSTQLSAMLFPLCSSNRFSLLNFATFALKVLCFARASLPRCLTGRGNVNCAEAAWDNEASGSPSAVYNAKICLN